MKEIERILEEIRLAKSELEWIEVKRAKEGIPEKIHKTLSALSNR